MASLNYKTDITFQFLLYLIRKHIHKSNQDYVDEFDIQKIEQVDFDKLFKLITYHKVELIVLPIIKEINIPKFDYNRLSLRAKKIVTKQLLMEKLLSNILSKFTEHNIENIVLKGLPLDKKLYGSQGKRVYGDIDILIKEEQLRVAHDLLLDLGFCLEKDIFSIDFISNHSLVRKALKDLVYINKEYNIVLELHWRVLIIGDFKYDIYNECSENFQQSSKVYKILKEEYCLSYLIIHGYRSGWHRLKWLIDIVDFIQNVKFDRIRFKQVILDEFDEYRSVEDLNVLLKDFFEFISYDLDLHRKNNLFQRYACKYRVAYIKDIIYERRGLVPLIFKKALYHMLVYPNKYAYFKTNIIYMPLKKIYLMSKK
ncbi:nucleotidyltransferase family protein [Francisella tularensis]|uniref:nucleotidyltransferase family protein n=1 Tax=Francisella tularensis TaxID=263 RepID=UPI0001855402|nr:nucleotidyltransferase family protein [Francisella tularensis]EDZ91419.1 hypothetical protein FTG_1615 [Francisella tularensis subsp. novicida FTG]MBK2336272.1 nucleotidyltransferase family protein [Francisella tularensis subsp. novicida]